MWTEFIERLLSNRKLWIMGMYVAIFVSAMMFFTMPHHEYVPKLIYFAIASGFVIRHFLQGNLRAAILCAVAAFFVLITLPNAGWIKETETIVILMGLLIAGLIFRRRKMGEERGTDR